MSLSIWLHTPIVVAEQLRLDGTEVAAQVKRLPAATRRLGLTEVAKCREVLAEAAGKMGVDSCCVA